MKDSCPKVSVIVPFYNIHDCVEYCVNSLLRQTYPSCEFILVDDASTDMTGKLLDHYQDLDQRIIVIHQKHGGLSTARNTGIASSTGKYVAFVDGDDVVSPYYIASMVAAAKQNPGSMAIAKIQNESFKKAVAHDIKWEKPSHNRMISQEQMIHDTLYNRIPECAYGKLFLRSDLTDDFFPIGKVYEDLATIGKILSSCRSFVLISEPTYGYVQRTGSIVHRRHAKLTQANDYIDAINSLTRWAYSQPRPLKAAILYRTVLSYVRLHSVVVTLIDQPLQARKIDSRIIKYVRRHYEKLLMDSDCPLSSKIRFLIFALCPKLHDCLLRLVSRK